MVNEVFDAVDTNKYPFSRTFARGVLQDEKCARSNACENRESTCSQTAKCSLQSVTRVSVVVRRTSSEHFASSEHCSEHFAVCEHASVRIQLLLCKRADTAASLQARQTMFRPLNFVCEPRDGKVDVDEAYQLVLTMYIQINRQAPIDPPPRPLVLPKCCDIFRSC